MCVCVCVCEFDIQVPFEDFFCKTEKGTQLLDDKFSSKTNFFTLLII